MSVYWNLFREKGPGVRAVGTLPIGLVIHRVLQWIPGTKVSVLGTSSVSPGLFTFLRRVPVVPDKVSE